MSLRGPLSSGPDFSNMAVDQYAQASARACVFELKSRMFADNVMALRCFSRGNFSQLVGAITDWMIAKGRATPVEHEHLKKCVTLRNKILHADLSRAAVHAKALGADLDEGNVKQIEVPGKFALQSFMDAIADEPSHLTVSTTKSEHVPIFAWLMESWQSGVFVEAETFFDQAIAILRREVLMFTDDDRSSMS